MSLGTWIYRRCNPDPHPTYLHKTTKPLQTKKRHKLPMQQRLKKLPLFILIFFTVSYKIFLPELFDPIFYDMCSRDYVDRKVETLFENGESGTKRQRDKYQNAFQPLVKNFNVKPEDLPVKKKAFIKFVVLKKNKCSIPETIKREVFMTSNIEDGSSIKNCAITMFSKENTEKLNQVIKYQAHYKKLEDNYFITISKSITNPRAATIFKEKWQDASYRKSIIIAAMQIADRKKNGCKNATLPLNPFIEEFMDYMMQ